jgi:ABC-type multidrug transport system fused ATPase/permease subunit
MRASPGLAVSWWLLTILRALVPAAFVVAIGVLMGTIQRGEPLGPPLAVTGVLFVLMQAIGPLHGAMSANLGSRTSAWLHDRLLEAALDPPGLAHLENPAMADELSAARDFDLGITGPNLTVSMPYVGTGLATLGSGVAHALLLAGYRWWAPLLVGGAWLSTHHLLRPAAVWLDRMSPEVMEEQRRADYAYRLTVNAPAAKEVRLFGIAPWVVDGFASIRRRILDRSWEERRLRFRPTNYAIMLIALANVVFFVSLASSARAGSVELGALIVFAQAAIGTSALAFGEFDWWLSISAQPVPIVLGLLERMRSAGALAGGGERSAEAAPASEIRFENVRFTYPTGNEPVLESFDLVVPAGRSLAIVGQNGAGKTTLAKLLCRMYDPQEGAILVDGHDLRTFDLASWRSRLAPVFQDFVRYEWPLRENVAPGGAPEAALRTALRTAGAEQVADLDTVLSRAYEGGTDLSGGQWQRVALARALLAVGQGAGVVVLDEPTAHLDARSEMEIFDRVLAATRGCTTILVSHRFSTVRRADLICVIEHGRVIELGSHHELIALGGRYRTMFELQAARFDEPGRARAVEVSE